METLPRSIEWTASSYDDEAQAFTEADGLALLGQPFLESRGRLGRRRRGDAAIVKPQLPRSFPDSGSHRWADCAM